MEDNEVNDKRHIKGLFKSRMLTLINTEEKRSLKDLELAVPFCVAPNMNMVNLLNSLQAGKGHMVYCMFEPSGCYGCIEK